jgi:beta-hydroxylase
MHETMNQAGNAAGPESGNEIRPTFFALSEFPWTRDVEAAHDEILAECASLRADEYGPYPGEGLYNHSWNLFPFYVPGRRFERNLERCPKTAAALRRIPNATLAMFSRLGPGAHVKPHHGHSTLVLRYHLGVLVPPGATAERLALRVGRDVRPWEAGKSLVFDDMNEHEAWNRTDATRVVLMVDFLRPFRHRTSLLGHVRQRLMYLSPQWRRRYAEKLEGFGPRPYEATA